jgi:poly(3-hydroxyoctanoate) depolymerase
MRSNFEEMVELDGCKIRVSVRGEGPPLLMFNGLGAFLEILDPLREALSGFTTIAFDAPGVGRSAKPRRFMRMQHHAHLGALLLDHLGVERADIFGVSWGGALAQEFTFRHPDRVRRIILAATTAGPVLLMRPDLYLSFFDMRDRSSKSYLNKVAPKLHGGKVRQDPHVLERMGMLKFLMKKNSAAYYVQMAAAAGWSSLRYLFRMDNEALILAGDDDPIVRAYNAQILSMGLCKSELKILRNEGHFFIVTAAEETASLVREFLERPERVKRSRAAA